MITLAALALAVAPQADGRPLFNGVDLNGWHAIGAGEWRVEDGILRGTHSADEKKYGHLVSDEVFADFVLTARVRILQGNSGLYFRAVESGPSGVSGFHAEIDPQRKTGGLYDSHGRGWLVAPSAELTARTFRPNDWNELRISALGSRTLVTLNGERTALFDEVREQSGATAVGRRLGHVALQLHGGQDVRLEVAAISLLELEAPFPHFGAAQDARFGGTRTLDTHSTFAPPETLDAWRRRSADLRRQVLVATGLWPLPPRTPLEPLYGPIVERSGYTVQSVSLLTTPHTYLSASLYRPAEDSRAPRPGVLSPHGHWAGGRLSERGDAETRAELESGAEREEANARYHLQARCAQLARMGCVVLHYDMVGFGDLRQLGHGQGFGDLQAELHLQSALGLQTWNSVRAFDFLSELGDVDPARIGVTGGSGGGTQTFLLCAVDPRPAAAFPAAMVSASMQGGCVCENAAHLRVGTNNIEIAALTAPRPMALSACDDWTIDIEADGLPQLRSVYSLFERADSVQGRCWPEFPHNYNVHAREFMYGWFARHLGLRDTPQEERVLDPVPPALLKSEHARDRALDEAGIEPFRTWWRESSELSLRQLSPAAAADAKRYHTIVGGALEVLLHSPRDGERDARGVLLQQRTPADAGLEQELVLTRQDGEGIPARWWQPSSWNGTVVVAGCDPPLVRDDPFVAGVLERGSAVLAPAVFRTGVFAGGPPPPEIDTARHARFAGYTWCYNPTVLARRVHDLRTALAYARARPGVERVHLAGIGAAGPWALLARAVDSRESPTVQRTLARSDWDFARVTGLDDVDFLPGASKYGGLPAFTALCAPGPLMLVGASAPAQIVTSAYSNADASNALRHTSSARGAAALDWLVGPVR